MSTWRDEGWSCSTVWWAQRRSTRSPTTCGRSSRAPRSTWPTPRASTSAGGGDRSNPRRPSSGPTRDPGPARAAAMDGGLPFSGQRGPQPDLRPCIHRRLRRACARQQRHPALSGTCQRQVRRRDQLRTTDAPRPQPLMAPGRDESPWWNLEGFLYLTDVTEDDNPTRLVSVRDTAHIDNPYGVLMPGAIPRSTEPSERLPASGLLPGLQVRHVPPRPALRFGHRRPCGGRRRLQELWHRMDRLRHPAEPIDRDGVDGVRRGLDATGAGALRLAAPGHPVWNEGLLERTQERYPARPRSVAGGSQPWGLITEPVAYGSRSPAR